MVMNEENVKERLIQATMDLLKKEKSAKKLTARKNRRDSGRKFSHDQLLL